MNINNNTQKSKYNKINFYTKDNEDNMNSIDEKLINLNQKALIDDVKFFEVVQEPMFISMKIKYSFNCMIYIQIYVSQFLYLNIGKEMCINNYKEILDMKIDLFKPLENV